MSFVPDFDHHIHTIYSGHSGPDMFIPAVMGRCREQGLKRAVIVEHVPAMMSDTFTSFSEWVSGRNDRTAINAIISEVCPRREQFREVEVLVGAEIDADPEHMDGSLMLGDLGGVDLILASTHILPGGQGFWFNPPETEEAEKPELLDRWLAWTGNIAANPLVNVIAHPGAEMHNCGLTGDFGPAFRAGFEPVLMTMAAQDTAFELNETAMRRFSAEALEGYIELVRLARECGARFSAGSDAHHGKSLGDYHLVPEVISRAELSEEQFIRPMISASKC